MTNQEAIIKLTNIMHDDHYAWHPSILTAFGMAVDALKADGDCISRQAAIDEIRRCRFVVDAIEKISELPSAQPTHGNTSNALKSLDCIDRQDAIEDAREAFKRNPTMAIRVMDLIKSMPSAQPEQRCVNCGRTANNGGWYKDGRTRCPIEEHYALPKDGYCHLWEKRNVTDDDYSERRTDE